MYAELYYSDSASKYLDSDENPDKDVNTYSWKKDAFFIRRDFSTSQETDLITFLGKNYLINDSLQCPNWKVLNDLKEVAGHICMSASWEDTLKEQEIIAWFAMDIPSSAGPERFCGLPGLILEIDINNGAMIASADKITFSPITAEQLALPTKPKGKSIKETEYQTLYAKHIEDKRKNEDPWFWGVRY
jgi:GLPGLI family protein